MDDAALVGVVHRLAERQEEAEPEAELRLVQRAGAAGEIGVELAAAHQLHGEEVLPLLGAPGVVDGADVRMLEAREGVDLALEHPDVLLVHEAAAADDLERHPSPRVLLLRLVDDPHAALAELAEDAVGAEHPGGRRGAPDGSGSPAPGAEPAGRRRAWGPGASGTGSRVSSSSSRPARRGGLRGRGILRGRQEPSSIYWLRVVYRPARTKTHGFTHAGPVTDPGDRP